MNGGFFIRGTTGQYYAMTWANIGDPAANPGRTELVRYDSPSWHGFIYSASIAEAGDYWGTMLRYAGEFSGFRIAAGIGYENVTDKLTSAAGTAGPNDFFGWRSRGKGVGGRSVGSACPIRSVRAGALHGGRV